MRLSLGFEAGWPRSWCGIWGDGSGAVAVAGEQALTRLHVEQLQVPGVEPKLGLLALLRLAFGRESRRHLNPTLGAGEVGATDVLRDQYMASYFVTTHSPSLFSSVTENSSL